MLCERERVAVEKRADDQQALFCKLSNIEGHCQSSARSTICGLFSPVANLPHASMRSRRRSKKSVRLYAASTAFGTAWANAASAISPAADVCSAAQSRNELRK